MSESLFSPGVRARALALGHRDPDIAYREMMLDIRVGGPVTKEILSALSHPATKLGTAEAEVVALLCLGFRPAEIAAMKVVQADTVVHQMKNSRRKMGVRTTAQMTAVAVAHAAAGDGTMGAALLRAAA